MNKRYWDSLARDFSNDVLEIVDLDLEGVLRKEIKRLSGSGKVAADLGCGPGSLTRRLAPVFQHVYALDLSAKLLEGAKERVEAENVTFMQRDLCEGKRFPFSADVSFCLSTLILPSPEKRALIADSVRRASKIGGHAVVSVPSYESAMHVYQSLVRMHRRSKGKEGMNARAADKLFGEEVASATDGIINIGGERTKHWMREEICQLLMDSGFEIEAVERIEYPWGEEISGAAAKAMPAAYPWDWMVRGRRVR